MARRPESEWGKRAERAGLDRETLALLAGIIDVSVSRALNRAGGPPGDLIALILAWELMSADQRSAWLASIRGERETAASAIIGTDNR